jgi:hypothetical protein
LVLTALSEFLVIGCWNNHFLTAHALKITCGGPAMSRIDPLKPGDAPHARKPNSAVNNATAAEV